MNTYLIVGIIAAIVVVIIIIIVAVMMSKKKPTTTIDSPATAGGSITIMPTPYDAPLTNTVITPSPAYVPPAQTAAATPPPPSHVYGRVIKIFRKTPSGSDADIINLGEVRVKDPSGNSLMGAATAQSGSHHGPFVAGNLIDGNETSIFHTAANATPEINWVSIDLGSDQPIGSIEIINRKDCCGGRSVGLGVSVFDSANREVYSTEIKENRAVYNYRP
jgi:hypothetical protein